MFVKNLFHVDIHPFSTMTIGSFMFCLIVIDEFSSYMHIVMIKSKAYSYLVNAFGQIISHFLLFNHVIKKIECDSESNLGLCADDLNSKHISLDQVPPYQHSQRIERNIRTLNDRMRSVLDTLQFYLPLKLYGELLSSVIIKHNALPTSNHPTLTPRLIFSGTKLDLKETQMLPFGTLCMFHMPGNDNIAKLEPRSQLGVSLGPSRRHRQVLRAFVL
jgi:hypothetical protein